MELSGSVEWALHCCWLLAQIPGGAALPGRRLGEFHGLPQPYLTKLLTALVRAGLLTSLSGPRGGYRLARAAEQISVLDVVAALEGETPMFRCQEIRQRGPVPLPARDCRRPCGIAAVMHRAEQAWRDQLAQTSLADLLDHASTGSRARAGQWLSTINQASPPPRAPEDGR